MSSQTDLSQGVAFIDGEYVPIAEARIPVLDWGFTRSDVTYDVVHVWQGRFFRLQDHLDRFATSCAKLRLDPGVDRDALGNILITCVQRSGLRDAYVEMTCSRGVPQVGSRDPRTCINRLIAFAIPFVWVLSPEVQATGGHLHISDVPRITPASVDPTVKNFHWGDLTRGLMQALDHGADTAALVDPDGNVSEGPGFNIFCVNQGQVLTPGGTVLEGVTRKTVSELCQSLAIPFSLGRVRPDDLREADEVFLSSTAGGVMPISKVDDRVLGNGRPGPLTTKIRDAYWAWHDDDRYCTPVDYGTVR